MKIGRVARVRDRPTGRRNSEHIGMMSISKGHNGNSASRNASMVFRFVVLAVTLSALDAHAVFGGRLSESSSREGMNLAAASAPQMHANNRMVWTGVAVADTGV